MDVPPKELVPSFVLNLIAEINSRGSKLEIVGEVKGSKDFWCGGTLEEEANFEK